MKYGFSLIVLLFGMLVTGQAQVTSIWLVEQNNMSFTDVPVTFGHVFAPGDVPTGASIDAVYSSGTHLPTQVDAKATHADGSLRHAVITIMVPRLIAGETKRVLLQVANSTPSPSLSCDELLETEYDAHVSLLVDGQLFTASVRDVLQQDRSQTAHEWLSGELVTEWLIRAPLRSASGEEHPHLIARFHVRAYKDYNYVRTDVIIENNWAYEPQPSGFRYDVSISIGGVQVYSKAGLEHTVHARWRKVFWWRQDPNIFVKHNLDYLVRTKAIPNYDRRLTIPTSVTSSMRTACEPMENLDISDYMPATGAQDGIGPLPRWVSLYLLTMAPEAKLNTLANGDAAGSYAIHYRDKNTDLPVTLDDYPYMTLMGNEIDTYNPNTGKYESFPEVINDMNRYSPDDAHQPSLAYAPYLVTGDYYFLEELQFWANWNMILANPYYRDLEKGLLRWTQVRGQAWSLRTLGHAAYITPDAHPLKDYFVTRVQNNIQYYRTTLVENPQANQLGYLEEGALLYGDYGLAPWQDDFFTWAVGHLVELGFADARPLFVWKAKFVLGRMASDDYCWLNASAYALQVGASNHTPFTTFAQVQQANFGNSPCAGLEMLGYPESATGFGADMQPALALVTEADLSGAKLAWSRYESREPKQDYSVSPQFALVPREQSSDVLPPPTISPIGGVFEESVTVTLSSLEGADIYYTLDGSAPTEQSVYYTGPFELTQTTTLQAIACKQGMTPSEIASALFTITPDLTPPTILSVSAHLDPFIVEVFFSKAVSQSAEVTANYHIDKGVTIFSATLDSSSRKVTLATSDLEEHTEYTLTVSNITDCARNPNMIADNTVITFYAGQVGVELSSFTALWQSGVVDIAWTTECEMKALGYNLQKKSDQESSFLQLNDSLIRASGTSVESRAYHYTDSDVETGTTYYYLLQQLDFDGACAQFGPISITTPQANEIVPDELTLYHNYPNPFNGRTTIVFALPHAGLATIEILTICGQRIELLTAEKLAAGRHELVWNGAHLPSGIYIVRLHVIYADDRCSAAVHRKMILVK
ncbi:chitobiase/beta-hexosaminidase C-terminal domain-containing protein [candidate division KSB1 bacterium]|nr:chitobiase/beta-hexosaminidase C-terminal domain-containing protein [candidate division KSB1 bacterium]